MHGCSSPLASASSLRCVRPPWPWELIESSRMRSNRGAVTMAALHVAVCLLLVPRDSRFYAGGAAAGDGIGNGGGSGDIEIQRVSAVPAIFTLKNFASKEECVSLLILHGRLSSGSVGCTRDSLSHQWVQWQDGAPARSCSRAIYPLQHGGREQRRHSCSYIFITMARNP